MEGGRDEGREELHVGKRKEIGGREGRWWG